VEIKVGSFRLKLAPHRVELRERGAAPAVQASPSVPKPADPGMELDLRGMIVDDMLVELDRYLDTAYLAGLPWVRIIHGKGTGRLRQVIREALKMNGEVKSFEEGGDKEGGEGVTVVHLE